LKLLLQGSARATMRELTGTTIEKWLDVELPQIQNPRADLVGESAEGDLVHIELQSTNDSTMPLRMAEYCLGVLRQFGQFPRQVLLYVGEAPLKMAGELRAPDVWFRYRAIDIRDLDGDRLLESDQVGDNVIAVLARLRDGREAVRKIVGRIAGLAPAERDTAMSQLTILAGLRDLEESVEQETQKMPITIDLMKNKVIAREYRRGLQEGLQEGRQEGEIALLRRQIEKRFGALPAWVEERLASRSTSELEDLGVRVLDAQSLEELLQ